MALFGASIIAFTWRMARAGSPIRSNWGGFCSPTHKPIRYRLTIALFYLAGLGTIALAIALCVKAWL